ncbi:Beta-lactamase class C penicillin binding protein [Paenibacillus pasadenensis]|uniref:Beta-lactamase class C penicillin binding protein n=1 Tax=Paenibacillus pasadenensis TaxID=217090 RepID=A0A2N5N4K6_9BACL|nr:serine hydrolase domain-containing protein [Paenibacillus pasadenensis]PLT45275.1 Beta-lactamase class C penicillin binding protein [Paenibacillus pasadenensis]
MSEKSEDAVLERLLKPLREAVERKWTPGAAAAVHVRGASWSVAVGATSSEPPDARPVGADTLYDCASLTKVAATLPLTLRLAAEGRLRLDEPASRLLPELAAGPSCGVTIRQLLAHTSGLPSSENLHSPPAPLAEALRRIAARDLRAEPGTSAVYSDIGFLLLGELASRAAGLPLDEAVRSLVWEPLGMERTSYGLRAEERPVCAPTERDAASGRFWQGVVHDENARALGGVAGHAGMFSTAQDLLRYAAMWLGEPPAGAAASGDASASAAAAAEVLPEPIRREALRLQTSGRDEERRGLGWVLRGDKADCFGSLASGSAFGHTGFTGTSLMVDPERGLAVVLLTNRVHFGRGVDLGPLRREFHDAACRLADELPG